MGDLEWSEFRAQMPVASKWCYLDHAAVAPLPQTSAEQIREWAREASEEGDTAWPLWSRRVEVTRSRAAEIIGATTDEIALVPSTTAGLGLVAEGIDWRPGDNVVTLDNEFPSNLYPWLNLQSRGVTIRSVNTVNGFVDFNRINDACDERTRIVAISWVGYASGWRIDVGELAELVHRKGALLCLDAIQGLGVFPLDVHATQVDFLAADGHKWLLGPEGCGIFYVRKDLLPTLRPLGVGWNSVRHRYDFDKIQLDLRDEAARYEGGSHNAVGAIGLGASLELLQRAGLASNSDRLASRVIELANRAEAELLGRGARFPYRRDLAHATGILTFSLPGHDPQELRKVCLNQGVVLSCRGGGIRLSFHVYNDDSDLIRLFEALPAHAATA
ncbi:MAG: aminotransferase class V-fold PLP-dependent enzyme [Planctomycetales bacterium]|nr:aminotransferase class V-fold PLP-dependent enzyme [Planctomycetales bacterium]